jgi:uncharacterized RDD family membrane protein YckC
MGLLNPKRGSKFSLINVRTQEVFELHDGSIIGREKTCSIVLNDIKVSRTHLKIRVDEVGEIWLKDTSSNGTFLNGERIHDELKVTVNSTVKLGNSEFKIVISDAQENKAPIKNTRANLKFVKNFKATFDSYPPAPTFRRFVASVIDGIILTILAKIPELFLKKMMDGNLLLQLLLGAVATVAYYHYFYSKKDGQTVGKKAMKLKVVSTDNRQDISVLRVLGRDYFLKNVLGFFSIFTVLFTKEKLALHDRFTKTRVIDVSKVK